MKFNTRKAVIAMFSISVLVILVLNFGIGDSQQQGVETQYLIDTVEIITPDIRYEEQQKQQKRYNEKQLQLERKSVINDTFSISEPMLSEPESTVRIYKEIPLEMPIYDEPETRNTSSEQQVIVVQMPTQQQGVDWKSLISWGIAALNGVVLLLMNIKNLKKR